MDFGLEGFNALMQSASGMTNTLRGAVDLTGSIKALLKSPQRTSDAEIEAAVNQLSLTMENASLNNRMLEAQLELLMHKVRSAQEAKAKLDAYELYTTQEGHLVYKLKEPNGTSENTHFICPKCYEAGLRSLLQGGQFSKQCLTCNVHFTFKRQELPKRQDFSKRYL